MKIIKLSLLIFLLCTTLWAMPINSLDNELLVNTLLNIQTEDCPLFDDYPTITLGNPYSWKIHYENKGKNRGGISIPIGAVPDVKYVQWTYKITSLNNTDINLGCRYNIPGEHHIDYIGPLGGKNTTVSQRNLQGDELELNITKTLKTENFRYDNLGYASAVVMNFIGSGSADIEIFSISVVNSKGEIFDVFSYDWDMRAFTLPPNVDKTKIPMPKNTVYIGMWTPEVACEEGRNRILRLKELIPNLGCDCSSRATTLLYYKNWFLEHNIPAYFQSCGVIDIEPVVSEYKAHSVHVNGNSRDVTPRYGVTPHHYHDMTDANIKKAYKNAVSLLGDYGIGEFQFIDSVWPYWDGNNFGYGEKAIEEYRKALNSADGGINYGVYGEEGKNLTFHDYLMETSGISITPQECGFNSWDEFVPYPNGFTADETKIEWKNKNNLPEIYNNKAYFVFNALKRYEYLKHYSDIGETGVEHGCNLAAMPNGDNWANANDYIGLLQLRDLKTVIDETRFYHPIGTMSAYSTLPTWRKIAQKFNKNHRIITEIGCGGGADIYWEPKLSYILQWTAQSIGHYDSMQTDWIYGGIHENSDPRGQKAWLDFLCKAWGYNDATNDISEKTNNDMNIIHLTTPMGITCYDKLQSSLQDLILDTDYPKTSMDFRAFDILKPNPKLLILDTMFLPEKNAKEITDLVKKKKMSVLFNAYGPGVVPDGNNYTNWWYPGHTINKSDLFSSLIGEVFLVDKKEIKGNINGISFDYSGEYYDISKQGKTIIEVDGLAILTKISVPGGGPVYYYHLNGGVCKELDKYVFETIAKDLKTKKESESENAYAMRFIQSTEREALALFNTSVMDSHKMPNIEYNYYEIKAPGAVCSCELEPKIKGEYVIYDFINQKIIGQNKGKTKITMNDISANIYYFIPKSKSETFIKTLNERFNKIDEFYKKFNLE